MTSATDAASLFAQYSDRLVRYLSGVAGEREAARDLTQEVAEAPTPRRSRRVHCRSGSASGRSGQERTNRLTSPHSAAFRLRAHVEMLADTIGERHLWRCEALDRAARYVSAQFETGGYVPQWQTFEVAKIPVSNVEATLTGTEKPAEIVVVGAHYDSVSACPGANDNGTGVAATLELADRFSRRPQPRTLRFVAFVNEEPPFFRTAHMGSVVYANAARDRGDRIVAMLALETMGFYSDEKGSQHYPAEIAAHYPDVGNFIGFVANSASEQLLQQSRQAFERRTRFPLQLLAAPDDVAGVGWSDHWSFWQAGYPAMMVTDTAPFRYPWYHTADDTADKVDYEKLSEVVDGLEAVIEALAG